MLHVPSHFPSFDLLRNVDQRIQIIQRLPINLYYLVFICSLLSLNVCLTNRHSWYIAVLAQETGFYTHTIKKPRKYVVLYILICIFLRNRREDKILRIVGQQELHPLPQIDPALNFYIITNVGKAGHTNIGICLLQGVGRLCCRRLRWRVVCQLANLQAGCGPGG